MQGKIQVSGLREFRSALRQVDDALPRGVRVAMNVAANMVIDDARPGIPRKTGRASGSLVPRSTQKSVRIATGGKRAAHYPWLDFGGRVGKYRQIVRPFIKDGRYLYNAYYRLRDTGKIQQTMQEALVDLARKAGMEVT